MIRELRTFGGWLLFAVTVYAAYHLAVLPLAWTDGFAGLAVAAAGTVGLLGLAPAGARRRGIAFAFLVLFADRALAATGLYPAAARVALAALVIGLTALVGRAAGRLPAPALLALAAAAALSTAIDRPDAKLLGRFLPPVRTPALYGAGTIDYFPLFLDPDHPGRVVTFGNREEVPPEGEEAAEAGGSAGPEGEAARLSLARLAPERLYVYAFDTEGGTFRRVAVPDAEVVRWFEKLRNDSPGYPFFTVEDDGTLRPLVTRDAWAETLFDFGRTFGALLRLDALHLRRPIAATDVGGPFAGLRLTGEALEGTFDGRPFRLPTDATAVVGRFSLGGEAALVLQGRSLEIAVFPKAGAPRVSHRLSPEAVPDIYASEVIPVQFSDGPALLLSFPTDSPERAKIVRPEPDGSWRLLFEATDPLFRFEDVRYDGGQAVLLALAPGRLSGYPQRLLGEYVYENGRLARLWQAPTSLINVRYLPGPNGTWRLVATEYPNHRLVLLTPHPLPVGAMIAAATGLIAVGLLVRRLRDGRAPQDLTPDQNERDDPAFRRRAGAVGLSAAILFAALLAGAAFHVALRSIPSARPPGVLPALAASGADGGAPASDLPGAGEPALDLSAEQAPGEGRAGAASPATGAPEAEAPIEGAGAETPAARAPVDARAAFRAALAGSEGEGADRFQVVGYTRNSVHKRKTTSMVSGAVIRPERLFGGMRLAGTPYRYYQSGDVRYLWTARTEWVPLPPADPPALFRSLEALMPEFAAAERLPDGDVLGLPAKVYRIRVNGETLFRLAGIAPDDAALRAFAALPATITVKLLDDPARIGEIEGRWLVPVPGAGYALQEVFFRFFHYGDPSIAIRPPEDIERYLAP
ncbi:hypothetical protein [Hydrogenibacillus sp. N12]|uniref:hypothetical protein n=1 Tax=Hydrogenibacillus sp. N12 TaxID=2866627 RepID=UPI001C7CB48B|nr:hypothetical protein [Hydrogenibacillus sp. N12]QZA32414.1 hypothetical protein K2M58_08820 [Hydrogenibacillus sp. N12]